MATEKEIKAALAELEKAWDAHDFSESGLGDLEMQALYIRVKTIIYEKGPKKNYQQFIAAHLKMAVESEAEMKMVPQGSHPDRPPLLPSDAPVCYTFRAKSECTKVVKKSEYMNMADGHGGYKRVVTGDKTAIKIAFDVGGNFLLTESFAAMHNMSIEEMYELIISFGDYGIEFLCIAGPGINPSEEDLRRVSERTPDMIKTVQGPR